MTGYVPIRDMQFALHDVLHVCAELAAAGIDLDRDTVDGVLDGIGSFTAGVLAPLNGPGDREGCRLDGHDVTTPAGFRKAYQQYVDGGWPGVTCEVEHGGGGLPTLLTTLISEMLNFANPAFSLYPGLSGGAYRCLNVNASEELKRRYLPKLATGEWTGTMCLTEPHCGTDLGLLTTRAFPDPETGAYRVSGTKMFISSGEHDLADNIVHLVLARLPGAPTGTRGISLFVVPKIETDDAGNATRRRNGVFCDGIEQKMGLHANATCVLRFEDAVGHLVGEPHRGLAAMFVMMNGARLGTAVQALGQAQFAHQAALGYARDRLQSRAPGRLHVEGQAADPIVHQPDVRRMLLTQQAWVGGARLFLYWLGLQNSLREQASDPTVRDRAGELLALLTPVAKAFVTDRAVETASLGVQVHGGAGYIADFSAEQSLRDVRILPIYEGTNGVQAHDLLARKVIGDDGRSLKRFLEIVREFVVTAGQRNRIPGMLEPLNELTDHVEAVAAELTADAGPDPFRVGAGAVDFLDLLGYLVYGYFWARAADTVLGLGSEAPPVHRRQLAVARYFFAYLLPDTAGRLIRLRTGSAALMDEEAIAW